MNLPSLMILSASSGVNPANSQYSLAHRAAASLTGSPLPLASTMDFLIPSLMDSSTAFRTISSGLGVPLPF